MTMPGKEFFEGIGMLLSWAFDRKARDAARLHAACQAANSYIDVDERNPPFDKLSDKKIAAYKLHFKKRVKAWS